MHIAYSATFKVVRSHSHPNAAQPVPIAVPRSQKEFHEVRAWGGGHEGSRNVREVSEGTVLHCFNKSKICSKLSPEIH